MARLPLFSFGASKSQKSCSGFSLIELLTVIAVIAMLAAIIFPAAATARLHAQQRQVMSNMRFLHSAMLLYKQDERGWPPSLGPVMYYNPYDGSSFSYNGLYPEWIRNRGVYESPVNELEDQNRLYKTDCGLAGERRWIEPFSDVGYPEPARLAGANLYGWNTMDGHVEETYEGPRYIPHYFRWRVLSRYDRDYKRQLGYRNPSEDTVVTWNDTFVQKDPENGAYLRGDIIVLFLNGVVKKFDVQSPKVKRVRGQYWRLKPD
ncbi:MAG: prepilin-type N-terminal cleavage/methylation domain-containing protein [Armatimonadetes bacterium]|nr:prepilin-type N-terminal cleavage/methylation domain-containing protein [Armatimonadota bacterium]